MIIEEEFGNDYYSDLVIDNYPNLQLIVVKENSLNNLNSLKICSCEKLKTIEIENRVLNHVMNVVIESISEMYFFSLYLPNLQSFKIGEWSFSETTSLSLSNSGNSNGNRDLIIAFLKLMESTSLENIKNQNTFITFNIINILINK